MKEKQIINCEFNANGIELCPDCGGVCTYVETLHKEPSLSLYYYLYFKCGLTLLLEDKKYTVVILCQADIPASHMNKDRIERHVKDLLEQTR